MPERLMKGPAECLADLLPGRWATTRSSTCVDHTAKTTAVSRWFFLGIESVSESELTSVSAVRSRFGRLLLPGTDRAASFRRGEPTSQTLCRRGQSAQVWTKRTRHDTGPAYFKSGSESTNHGSGKTP